MNLARRPRRDARRRHAERETRGWARHSGHPRSSVCLTGPTDTGGGIDPEVVDHVFEPFYTTKEQGRGTGLGLATAHGDRHPRRAARIHVYSEPGLGRDVPACSSPRRGGTATPGVRRAARIRASSKGSETVLLCEDEEALRFMVSRILGDAGYTVLSDARGRGGAGDRGRSATQPVDALVTDVIMPGLSGPEVRRAASSLGGRPRTLFLSGYTADALRDRANLPPGSAFLEKPFAPVSLLRALRTLLDGDGSPCRPRAGRSPGRARSRRRAGPRR